MPKYSLPKTSLIAAAGLAMALAACSKEPTVEESTPSAVPTQAAVEAPEIPEALRGRWGLVPADCTSTKGDTKGLMTVSADKLEFYESVASLGPVEKVGANSISAAYEFTGEGQTWIQDVALSLSADGKTLERKDSGPDAASGPLAYKKCP
jgi:hypothetical protein